MFISDHKVIFPGRSISLVDSLRIEEDNSYSECSNCGVKIDYGNYLIIGDYILCGDKEHCIYHNNCTGKLVEILISFYKNMESE